MSIKNMIKKVSDYITAKDILINTEIKEDYLEHLEQMLKMYIKDLKMNKFLFFLNLFISVVLLKQLFRFYHIKNYFSLTISVLTLFLIIDNFRRIFKGINNCKENIDRFEFRVKAEKKKRKEVHNDKC